MSRAAAAAVMLAYAAGVAWWLIWWTRAADRAGDPDTATRDRHIGLGAPFWPLLAPALAAVAMGRAILRRDSPR